MRAHSLPSSPSVVSITSVIDDWVPGGCGINRQSVRSPGTNAHARHGFNSPKKDRKFARSKIKQGGKRRSRLGHGNCAKCEPQSVWMPRPRLHPPSLQLQQARRCSCDVLCCAVPLRSGHFFLARPAVALRTCGYGSGRPAQFKNKSILLMYGSVGQG